MAIVTYDSIGIELPADFSEHQHEWRQMIISNPDLSTQFGYGYLWFQGPEDLFRQTMRSQYQVDPYKLYCPCSRCNDVVTHSTFVTSEQLTLAHLTLGWRNATLDRNGVEVQINPSMRNYTTPIHRREFLRQRRRRSLYEFMEWDGNGHRFYVADPNVFR